LLDPLQVRGKSNSGLHFAEEESQKQSREKPSKTAEVEKDATAVSR